MALEAEKRIGVQGLNLASDPAQLSPGWLEVADGIRYVEVGAAHSRLGRRFVTLDFPADDPYGSDIGVQNIPIFQADTRVRGFTPFYDQRLETRFPPLTVVSTHGSDLFTISGLTVQPPLRIGDRVRFGTTGTVPTGLSVSADYYVRGVVATVIIFLATDSTLATPVTWSTDGTGTHTLTKIGELFNLPQRLNFLYKQGTEFKMNRDWDGQVFGSRTFTSPNTRAKFVPYKDRVYIIDESTPPKVFRRRPLALQSYLGVVQYQVDRLGLVYPTSTSQTVTLAKSSDAPVAIGTGTYAFRIALENASGDVSNPTLESKTSIAGTAVDPVTQKITVTWTHLLTTFPADVTKVRIYVQYAATTQGTGAPTTQTSPSEYVYIASVDAATGTFDYKSVHHYTVHNDPGMDPTRGAPPKLKDMIIVNDIAYGIAVPDIVYRESINVSGARRIAGYVQIAPAPTGHSVGPRSYNYAIYDNGIIVEQRTDSSDLWISSPGEPDCMDNVIPIASGGETGVGLARLGTSVVIFTNIGIKVYDPASQELRTVPVGVGCLSRDTIAEVDGGILFLGTDGVPRIFNGASFSEVADEIAPIFEREDYSGYYQHFDKANAQEVSVTAAHGDFYVSYPVSATPTFAKPDSVIDSGFNRNMAVGNRSHAGRTRWSIDSNGYESVHWLGRESRLLAIDTQGYFYWIEESDVDDAPNGQEFIQYRMALRWFGENGLQSQFYALALDLDANGNTMTCDTQVDGLPSVSYETSVTTTARDERKFLLPSKFKGRYLQVSLYGTAESRIAFYGLIDEKARRGEFS